MRLLRILIVLPFFLNSQDSTKVKQVVTEGYKKGFAIYPLHNKAMIGYRSNFARSWVFDSKLGYTFTMLPLLNIELNLMHRHYRNEVLNFYSGFGFTLDGFTAGCIVPLGFEIKLLEKHKNIVFVAEASPKITFSFSSAFNSSFNGTIGVIYFRPHNKSRSKKHDS